MENMKSEAGAEAGAGAFGQWALLLAGARWNTRAGWERDEAADETVDGEPDSDEVADVGGGVEDGDAVIAGREV